MALLLAAFLAACSAGAPSGGGGGEVVAKGPTPVALGTAGNYVILAQSAISDLPPSVITGDIGISTPGGASSITGFSPAKVEDPSNMWWTAVTEVTGKIYASDNVAPTPATLLTAISDKLAAYNDAAGRTLPDFTNLGSGEIGGLTLAPGLYKWTTPVTISNDVTLNGGANDTWIFQISGTLTQSVGKKVILTGGAAAKNIVWQVASGATLGGTLSEFSGIILSGSAITLTAGSKVTGRLLALTAVTVGSSTVMNP